MSFFILRNSRAFDAVFSQLMKIRSKTPAFSNVRAIYPNSLLPKKSGIKYINTDLIAGLPDESFSSFSRSVDEILKLRPDNVTFHTFCVKKAADILKNGTDGSWIYSGYGQ